MRQALLDNNYQNIKKIRKIIIKESREISCFRETNSSLGAVVARRLGLKIYHISWK